jgi:hypothetical protein
MPTIRLTHEQSAALELEAIARGGTVSGRASVDGWDVAAANLGPRDKRPVTFVEPGVAVGENSLTIVVPTETKNEASPRAGGWHARARRTKSSRRILHQTMRGNHATLTPFVKAIDGGKALRITLTRLGGRKLDGNPNEPGDNLTQSLKATRDAVASLLLSDDDDPWLHWFYNQEPGGPVGVRVTVEVWG